MSRSSRACACGKIPQTILFKLWSLNRVSLGVLSRANFEIGKISILICCELLALVVCWRSQIFRWSIILIDLWILQIYKGNWKNLLFTQCFFSPFRFIIYMKRYSDVNRDIVKRQISAIENENKSRLKAKRSSIFVKKTPKDENGMKYIYF